MSKAAVTRHLAALEDRLGTRLIERNSRNLHVTEAGRVFYERCRAIHSEMREAENAISAANLHPRGALTVTSSVSFAKLHIGPLLEEYRQQYPNVVVQVFTANRYLDLVESGFDLAIRTREYEPDSSITIRKLASTRRVLAASPEYLERHGTPTKLEELDSHRLLQYTLANRPDELNFRRGASKYTVRFTPAMSANEGQVICAAALAGQGILVQPRYIIHDDVMSGRLVEILNDYRLPDLTINWAYPSRKFLSAKCRTFMEFLDERFREKEYERLWMA